MVNSKEEVNVKWVNYANAIESDLSFYSNGNPKEFYHGDPCNIFVRNCYKKDDVQTHFATIRRKAQDKSKNLALFWIDLKLKASGMSDYYSAGQKLADAMTRRGSLFPRGEEVPINVLLGAEYVSQKNFFIGFRIYIKNFRPELLPKFGYDISGGEDVDTILNTFKSIGIRENIWIGAGETSISPKAITNDLKKLVKKRDSGAGVAPSKVYAWTVDKTSSMRYYLQLGIDAIIVNYPDRMKNAVTDQFKDSLTLATPKNDPWKRVKSSQVMPPRARVCSLHIFGYFCYKYHGTGTRDYCKTSKRCNSSQDCWGNIQC